MRHTIAVLVLATWLCPLPALAQGKLNVMTTTEDLASIARDIGGDRVAVEALAKGYQDPHFVEAKPSFIKLQKADVLVAVGRDLEIGWLPPLTTQSRNAKIQPGGSGYLDASLTAQILELPQGQNHTRDGRRAPARQSALLARPRERQADRQGDGRQVQLELRARARAYFEQRLASFVSRLDEAEKRWLGSWLRSRARRS